MKRLAEKIATKVIVCTINPWLMKRTAGSENISTANKIIEHTDETNESCDRFLSLSENPIEKINKARAITPNETLCNMFQIMMYNGKKDDAITLVKIKIAEISHKTQAIISLLKSINLLRKKPF